MPTGADGQITTVLIEGEALIAESFIDFYSQAPVSLVTKGQRIGTISLRRPGLPCRFATFFIFACGPVADGGNGRRTNNCSLNARLTEGGL